jgi:hypothetical protein
MAKGDALLKDLIELQMEVQHIYTTQIGSGLNGILNNLPHTLYGYVMATFSHIDLISSYNLGTRNVSINTRMVHFLVRYMGVDENISRILIEMFRHNIVHTSSPRPSTNRTTGITYRWLLHWSDDQLPREQLFTIQEHEPIINLSLTGLLETTISGLKRYLDELDQSSDLQEKFDAVDAQLRTNEFTIAT